jgi:flavin-dependent dehydrogenase
LKTAAHFGNNSSDVLIVGGGPAGLAAALALRKRGATVTVADARKPPIDKACGEGLMPDSLRDLALLGVDLTVDDGAEIRGIRFANYSANQPEIATVHFPAGDISGAGGGVGMRRQALHARLVAQAGDAGAVLRWQSPVQLRDRGRVLIAGNAVRYDWLIGADGQSSQVRRWAGLEQGETLSRRFGFRQHLAVQPWSPYVEVHWGKTGQAYVTPTGPNEICVAAITRDPHCRLQTLLAEMPQLQRKLGESMAASTLPLDSERGALTTTRRLNRVAKDRIALVGDASGSVDAITGEGLGLAFRQALLMAECLEAGDLGRYNRLHPATLRLQQTMAHVLLLLDRYPVLRSRTMKMLAAEPELFARLLGVHLGSESLTRFAAAKGLELAWRLAVPSHSHIAVHPRA